MKPAGLKRWFVLAGLFFISFLENGLARSFAVILDDLTKDLETSTAYLGAIFGLVFGGSYFLAFLTIPLLRHFSVRQLTFFGGFVSTVGLILSSVANTGPQFSAALALFGLGYVVFISPTNSCPARYFPDRFGLATGILLSGGSTGVMLLPVVFESMVEVYGWRGAVRVLAAFNANIMVSGALLEPVTEGSHSAEYVQVLAENADARASVDSPDRTCLDNQNRKLVVEKDGQSGQSLKTDQDHQPSNDVIDREEKNINNHNVSGTDCCSVEDGQNEISKESNTKTDQNTVDYAPMQIEHRNSILQPFRLLARYFELNIFKDHPLLVLVCFQAFLYGLSFSGWLIFVIPNAMAKGVPTDRAVQLTLVGGVSNFVGRLGGGLFSSAGYVTVEVWYYVVNLITAAAFFINFIADSFWFLISLSAVYGVMIGAKAPAQFLLVMNATGKDQYSAGVSMLFFFIGLSFPVSGALFGAIFDGTQSYNIAFCIVGLLDIVVGHITLMPRLRSRFCKKASGDQMHTTEENGYHSVSS